MLEKLVQVINCHKQAFSSGFETTASKIPPIRGEWKEIVAKKGQEIYSR